MAEEQLNLIDGMTPALKNIYAHAERLNKETLTLKSSIKDLEKRGNLSYLRKQLKEVENQARMTQKAIRAVQIGEREGIISYHPFKGMRYHYGYGEKSLIRDDALSRYGQRIQDAEIRKNKMLWENGRIVNGMTFDERLAKFRNSKYIYGKEPIGTGSFTSSLYGAVLKITMFTAALQTATDILNSFIAPQDKYTGNLTRVALVSDKTYTPAQMMDKLYDAAIRTRADSEGTINLYNRIAMSGVKASNDRILRFVETFNKTMAISGTSKQENRAVMLQLAQGMGSNRLGGDEFRSIAEQAPMFKYMLAKGMGVNPGALKQMGAEGKLTAEAIMTALESVQDKIDEVFKDAPWTIGQLLTILEDKWQKIITHQMTGYIELRNMLKDFVNWLDTEAGKQFINEVVSGINYLIHSIVSVIKILTPVFKWIATHLKFIIRLTLVLTNLWAASKWFKMAGGVVQSFKIITTSGSVMWSSLSAGAITFGSVCAAVLGWITLIIGAMVVAWKIGQKIADHIQERKEMEALNVHEDMLAQNKQQAWEAYATNKMKEQGLTPYKSQGGGLGTKEASYWNSSKGYYEERSKWEKEYWAPRESQFRNSQDRWLKENELGQYKKTEEEKLQDELNKMTQSFEGAMNSAENVPMVGKVKEVGKVNDKISIDTEDIEMMKSIAERQWTMQNEVTVPQNVNMTITKEVDMDEEVLAQRMTNSMRTAVASSMRGKVE